jgi:hypothetical protein
MWMRRTWRSEETIFTNSGSSSNIGKDLDPWMHHRRVATVVSIITRIIITIIIVIITRYVIMNAITISTNANF